LDKPTSGTIAFSVSLEGARRFSALLRERKIRKLYLAITDGEIRRDEVWEDMLFRDHTEKKTFSSGAFFTEENAGDAGSGAKPARTLVSPLAWKAGRSLVLVEPESGRTHQIRSQAAARKNALSGDKKYGGLPLPGKALKGGGFFLHALALEFPSSEGISLRVKAPLPSAFRRAVLDLFGKDVLQCEALQL
jgi:23S rRNA pseudouridine955/2504/2580 synthase